MTPAPLTPLLQRLPQEVALLAHALNWRQNRVVDSQVEGNIFKTDRSCPECIKSSLGGEGLGGEGAVV